jgi:hypothetical protein
MVRRCWNHPGLSRLDGPVFRPFAVGLVAPLLPVARLPRVGLGGNLGLNDRCIP